MIRDSTQMITRSGPQEDHRESIAYGRLTKLALEDDSAAGASILGYGKDTFTFCEL